MREFLSDNDVPFDDRNIRQSEAARAELAARTDAPRRAAALLARCPHRRLRPLALEELVRAYRAAARDRAARELARRVAGRTV